MWISTKKNQLLHTVQNIVSSGSIKTPFKDGKPGEKWFKLFLHRNLEIAFEKAEGHGNWKIYPKKKKLVYNTIVRPHIVYCAARSFEMSISR
jgi:hypothetical protein